jgi:hypothetical protein
MKRTLVTCAVVLVCATGLSAQQVGLTGQPSIASPAVSGIGIKPAASPWSLLDLSRIRWSNSYSVAFFSGGGSSGSMGVLNTSLFYEFSSKLALTVNLGVAHNPGAIWGRGENNATFYPGFRLDYRPSDKVSMSLQVERVNGYYITPDGFRYYRPYGSSWLDE